MKKIILAVFVSVIMLSPTYASEEIQLASALGGTTSTLNAKGEDDRSGAAFVSRESTIGRTVIGAIVVGGLAVIAAKGFDSTSSH